MSMSSELSRRALAAASAAFAATPVAATRKKKRKMRKPPTLPPLAFATATVTDVAPNDDGTRFDLTIQLAFVHPASGVRGPAKLSNGIALAPSTEAARAEIIENVQVTVSSQLESAGQTVPPDRIAVALL